MGFLDLFKSKPATRDVPAPALSFGRWVDPPVAPPTAEWERRLNNYARKCARQLTEASVPLFRSEYPGGANTFRDAFWLIACDVEVADRVFVAHPPTWLLPKSGPGQPPPLQRGDFQGWFIGDALLLTTSGTLCSAQMMGGLVRRGGGVDDRVMNVGFNEIDGSTDDLRWRDWGWSNQGRWRRDPKQDYSRDGAKFYVNGERFERKLYRKAPWAEDGRDTSAALTSFMKTNGKVRWPRWFPS